MPPSAQEALSDQFHIIATAEPAALGLKLLFSLAVSIWSASRAAGALITGLNIAYDEVDKRGFIRETLLALGLTLGMIVFGILSLAIITITPHVLARLGLSGLDILGAELGRWLFLFGGMLAGLSVLYRWGPDRADARWQWVSVGSVAAAALWLLASILFSWYSSSLASFNEVYGGLAGVVVLLLWLQITAVLILGGAEVNAEIEHQTAMDSTVGPPRPLGERGAVKADHVGEARA